MKLDHDQIFPAGRHRLTLKELGEELNISHADAHRMMLWGLLNSLYCSLLKLCIRCELWIDGSFITKKPVPSDIDLSLMIDDSEYDRLSKEAVDFLFALDNQ